MTQNNPELSLSFNSARFLKSAAKLAQCPEDSGVEIAFAGRSNAGKSSAINAITNNRKLARTSKTPGRTQLINFFSLSQAGVRLVDLPGYGYAQVSLEMKAEWGKHLDIYLRERQCLAGLVLIMDIRKPLTDFDQMMLAWSQECAMPTLILLTKADKLKNNAARQACFAVKKDLEEHPTLVDVLPFSSMKKSGVEQCHHALNGMVKQALEGSA